MTDEALISWIDRGQLSSETPPRANLLEKALAAGGLESRIVRAKPIKPGNVELLGWPKTVADAVKK